MTQGEQAAVAVAAGTVIGLGLWLYGRWQRRELNWTQDVLVVLGAVVSAIAMAAVFMSRSAATYLVPSAVLLIGGLYLYSRAGQSRWQQVAAAAGAFVGSIGMVTGIIRMVSSA